MERENDDIKDGRKFIFTGAVIFSFVTLGLGIFGFFHHCIKHKAFPICYGIILFPSFVFLIVIGAVCIAVSDGAIETIDDECTVVNTNFDKSVEITRAAVKVEKEEANKPPVVVDADDAADQINSGGSSFRDKFTGGRRLQSKTAGINTVTIRLEIYEDIYVNQYMCSQWCPCKDTTAKKDWMEIPDKLAWNRRDDFVFVSGAENEDLNGKKYAKSFDTYKECVDDPSTSSDINNKFAIFKESFKTQDNYQTISDWLEFFETEYACTGFCRENLFSWSASYATGRVKKTCIADIKDDLESGFVGIMVMAIVAGIILFFTFIVQYFIWPKQCK